MLFFILFPGHLRDLVRSLVGGEVDAIAALGRAVLRFALQGQVSMKKCNFATSVKLFQDEFLRCQAILGHYYLHAKLF